MGVESISLENIINFLAWPVTTIVIVLIFRRSVIDFINSITKMDVDIRGIKARFETEIQRDMDNLNQQAHESLAEAAAPESGSVEVDLFDMAEIMPNSAVMEAWKAVVESAKSLIERRGLELDYDGEEPFKLIQDTLINQNIVEEKRVKIFDELRSLRNKVAHAPGFQIKPDQADDYVRLALTMKNSLDHLE